jgi:hypothetical protein
MIKKVQSLSSYTLGRTPGTVNRFWIGSGSNIKWNKKKSETTESWPTRFDVLTLRRHDFVPIFFVEKLC